MKKLIIVMFFACNVFAQTATSYVTIRIEPYTIIETNTRNAVIDETESGFIVRNVEIIIRNNTKNKTDLSAYITHLFDSTEIRANIKPVGNNNLRILGDQWIDINISNFASDIEFSNTFLATYMITTTKNQNIQEMIEAIRWVLTVR